MDHPVVKLLTGLMSIVSTSELEYEIGVFLENHLVSLGYTVERIPISKGSSRHNIYAYLGASRKTRVLLTAHMDTVCMPQVRNRTKICSLIFSNFNGQMGICIYEFC